MSGTPRRAALYARVSTTRQDTANQIREVEQFAKARGLELVKIYRETRPGWEPDREQLAKLYEAAHRREFDVVLVWALDRFSRQGIEATLGLMRRLSDSGIDLVSLREEFLSTVDPRYRELLLSLFAWVARQEHIRLSERVKAGLARRRDEGKRLGAKREYAFNEERARELRAAGRSWNEIADALKVPRAAKSTIRRVCRDPPRSGPSKTGRPKRGAS